MRTAFGFVAFRAVAAARPAGCQARIWCAMLRITRVTALVLAGGLLVSAPAEAAKWRGKTRQGRGVSVHTDANGVANYARIRFIAPCKDRTAVFSTIWFTTPLDHTSTTSFTDGGPWQ